MSLEKFKFYFNILMGMKRKRGVERTVKDANNSKQERRICGPVPYGPRVKKRSSS